MTEDLHRRLGVEANNETWRILDDGPPGAESSEEEKARFLDREYASAYHWIETPSGNTANRARSEHLIARAAIAVGLPEVGLRHAERCLEMCLEYPDLTEDWDLAFAEEAIARAHAAAGSPAAAREHYEKASNLGAATADDDDRDVSQAELAREPWFGVS